MGETQKKRISKYAAYVLPALLAGFCLTLYIVNSTGAKSGADAAADAKNEETAVGAAADVQSGDRLPDAITFMESAAKEGLDADCTELHTDSRERSIELKKGDMLAGLTLGLSGGRVDSFSLKAQLPGVQDGGSLILNDLAKKERQERCTWLGRCAQALLFALDERGNLTEADMDAFLLALDSTFFDDSSASGTFADIEYSSVVLPESGELVISAAHKGE